MAVLAVLAVLAQVGSLRDAIASAAAQRYLDVQEK
jgi:hypothetical protein